MKLNFTILLTFISILLLLVSCAQRERSYYFKDTKSIDLSKEEIEKIQLNNEINDEFIQKHGDLNYQKDLKNDSYNYYRIKGLIIAADKKENIITKIMFTKDNTRTSRGIHLNDSIDKVKDLYGDSYYNRVEQGMNIIGYIDTEAKLTLEFWYDNDKKIQMIRLDVTSME